MHGELDARPEDWPALQSILDREEQQRREAEEDDVPLVTTKNKKRKAVSSLASAVDDTHNPLYALHYHALSAEVKAALLYLHTCWMLHDDNIHAAVAEGAMRDTAEAAYGRDDANRRYWLFTHCEWGESRVHLYRETDAAAEEEYGWELLASNRDQLEEALALLQVQSSDNSRTLAYRIQYEALEFMGQSTARAAAAQSVTRSLGLSSLCAMCLLCTSDREGRLAERRQRRATRMELDLHNIIGADAVGDSGLGRARRARKQINYAEMEAGDVDRMAEEDERAAKESASELAERRRNGRGRRGQPVAQAALEAEQDQKWREEDEEELYAAKVMHAQQVSGEAEEHEQPTAQQQPAAEEPQTERSVEEQLWESALTNDQQPELDTVQTAHTQNGDSHLQPAAGGQTERQEADRYQLDATGSGDKIFGGPVSASADNNGLVPSPADAAPPPS